MRILVTGSLGTLGTPLVRELRERGHDVWGCDLRHSADKLYVRADVAEYRQLSNAFWISQPNIVFHLAAEFGRHNGEGWYEALWNTAAIGTRNVLELCRSHGARLAFASSSEVYGDIEPEFMTMQLHEWQLDEEVVLHPNEYALSKWVNERQILAFCQRHPEVEAMRLRFFNAYGPGEEPHDYRSVVALFCDKALRKEKLPVFEDYWRTFMFIDDFIPTLANVAEHFVPGEVVNIGGRDYRSVEDLARIVLDAEHGLEGYKLIQSSFEGCIERIPEDRHNTRSKRPSIRRAEELLGHDPNVTLEKGVPKTIAWMKGRQDGEVQVEGRLDASRSER